MIKDVVINEEQSRCRNVKIVQDIKEFMRNNDKVMNKESMYSLCTLLILISLIAMDVLLFICSKNEKHQMIPILSVLIAICFAAYYYCSKEAKNCKFDAIKKQFGEHDLFVFLVKEDISIKKIMVSNNRKIIRMYRKYYDLDIENDEFTVEGLGNNVYLIDLDEKCIYVD